MSKVYVPRPSSRKIRTSKGEVDTYYGAMRKAFDVARVWTFAGKVYVKGEHGVRKIG